MPAAWKRWLSKALTGGVHALVARQERRLQPCPLPTEDAFYVSTESLATRAPGDLLDWRPIELGSMRVRSTAAAWQLRYRSTGTNGDPISAVATLMVPKAAWLRAGPRPLLSYQCAIDSLGPKSDPSYTLRRGDQRETALMALALRRGWAVVAPDFTGPRRGYGAGLIAARITLDGVRASLAFNEADIEPAAPVGLWGYSGGGQATAWAAEQQPGYASELTLAAVAAGGVPTDNRTLYRIDGGLFSGLALGASLGISREYPESEVLNLLNENGRRVFEEIADMSVDELVAYFPFRRLSELSITDDPFGTEGALITNDELHLGRAVPAAPVYLYHSVYDQLVPIVGAEELAETYRQANADVTFHRTRLGEHCLAALTGVPGALRFLAARFAEQAARPAADGPGATGSVRAEPDPAVQRTSA
jgi:pimeloyl-ACP methyl ester carboxylesterase